jgi:hypothetical protein
VDNWHCFSVVAVFQARPQSFEDSYLVRRISVENGCYVQRRKATKTGESQCGDKIFLHEPRLRGGGGQKSRIESRKIKNCKIAKIQIRNFRHLAKTKKKLKIPEIARAVLTAIAEAKRALPLGRFSIPPLIALYWL